MANGEIVHLQQASESFRQEHQPCSFIPQKQLALYANLLFCQYGLLAFVSGCCAFNNKHRRKNASAAKVAPSKQEKAQ